MRLTAPESVQHGGETGQATAATRTGEDFSRIHQTAGPREASELSEAEMDSTKAQLPAARTGVGGSLAATDESRSLRAVGDLNRNDRRRLVQLACRFVWNQADAGDAVQDALANAQRQGDQVRDAAKWWSWLCRIVVRQCLLSRRSGSRRVKHEQAAAVGDVSADDDRIERNERAMLVRWAIERLPDQQRTAVTLRHLEEMSYERIGEMMEITPSTARGHVRAGREAIRGAIARREPKAERYQA